MPQVTLGLALHRPEMTALISERMRRHEAIFLEEPPDPSFAQMLSGHLAVDDYLALVDMEYPAFSQNMCYLLRALSAEGKKIFQVEPFLEVLLNIHELFAQGHHPKELQKNSLQYPVYLAERNAAQALLAYYQTVMDGSFDDTIGAIIRFARMDAARLGLRDSLRAQEIASKIENYSSYVEAGQMHYPLGRLLRQQLMATMQIKVIFLAADALKLMGQKGHLYGPGDQLTLLYVFHPEILNTRGEKELAARSIIYSKILVKEELMDNLSTFPHLRDELDCIRMTKQLSFEDCRRLFPLVRRTKSAEAREIVAGYLAELMIRTGRYLQPEKDARTPPDDIAVI